MKQCFVDNNYSNRAYTSGPEEVGSIHVTSQMKSEPIESQWVLEHLPIDEDVF